MPTMAAPTDFQGIAEIIGAIGISFPSIVAAIISIINLNRGTDRDVKLTQIHDLVNSQSEKLNRLSEAKGFEAGRDAERANPTEKK